MWTEKQMDGYLRENLKKSRYIHTYGVVKSAEELSFIYNCNNEQVRLAALLHDCGKVLSKDEIFSILQKKKINIDDVIKSTPEIMHGVCSAYIAEYIMGVKDEQVLEAINCHTTGKENMSLLDKIIYLADCIEENRNYDGVEELRKLAVENLNEAVIKSFEQTIKYVLSSGRILHINTIKARNYLIIESKYSK